METLPSSNSQNMREFRRLRAVELYESGWKPIDIAKTLNVTRGAVSQWLSRYRREGLDALRYKKYSKKPSKMSDEQKKELIELLALGAEYFGFSGEVWTQSRVCELISKHFGISYNKNYMGTFLKNIGWTCQKPVLRATQRDNEEVEKWISEEWPQIKKTLKKKEEQ